MKRLFIMLAMILALVSIGGSTTPNANAVVVSPDCDVIRTDCYEKYMVWWNGNCVSEWGNAWRGWCLSEASIMNRSCVFAESGGVCTTAN
jgi:hypothetical protein